MDNSASFSDVKDVVLCGGVTRLLWSRLRRCEQSVGSQGLRKGRWNGSNLGSGKDQEARKIEMLSKAETLSAPACLWWHQCCAGGEGKDFLWSASGTLFCSVAMTYMTYMFCTHALCQSPFSFFQCCVGCTEFYPPPLPQNSLLQLHHTVPSVVALQELCCCCFITWERPFFQTWSQSVLYMNTPKFKTLLQQVLVMICYCLDLLSYITFTIFLRSNIVLKWYKVQLTEQKKWSKTEGNSHILQ